MVCLDEATTDSDFDAHSEDSTIVDGAGIRIANFIGRNASASAVDILGVAAFLGFEVFRGESAVRL